MTDISKYEAVIGIEVHAELKTATKIFCSCRTDFGAEPNTLCCPVCMGLPGALPVLNSRVVELAVLAGLALNCNIAKECCHDRKNYFYPDLPKAYQISQKDTPLCYDGYIDINADGGEKRIRIERIHIEEDAGKLIHSQGGVTMIDHNRCGVPLIEIVSKPDMRSSAEAKAYLEELRLTLLYAGVSDCKMNEGSMRCDLNISVRKRGETVFNTRAEIKNLNSFSFAAKAIDFELARQAEIIEGGGRIDQETRRYDEHSGRTVLMRAKENSEDYRYFTEPDLPPFNVDDEWLSRIKGELPKLHRALRAELSQKHRLSADELDPILSSPESAKYFSSAASLTKYPRILANLMICELPALYGGEFRCPISVKNIATLCDLQGDGKLNSSTAKALLRELFEADADPYALVKERGLLQIDDEAALMPVVRSVIAENQKAVEDYKRGKTAAAKAIIGKVMAATRGRANPTLAAKLVENELRDNF